MPVIVAGRGVGKTLTITGISVHYAFMATSVKRQGGLLNDEPAATVTVELHLSRLYSAEAVASGEFSGSPVGGVRLEIDVRDSWPLDTASAIEEAIRRLLSELKRATPETPR